MREAAADFEMTTRQRNKMFKQVFFKMRVAASRKNADMRARAPLM